RPTRSLHSFPTRRSSDLGLADHEQRWASVGGGQRATDVVDDVGLWGFEHVRRRHSCVHSCAENSPGPAPRPEPALPMVTCVPLCRNRSYRKGPQLTPADPNGCAGLVTRRPSVTSAGPARAASRPTGVLSRGVWWQALV